MIYLEIIGGEGLKILIICTTWFVNRLKGFSLKQPAGRKLKRGKIPGQELATSELRSRAMGLAVGCGSRASERRGKLLPWYPSRYRLPTSWFKGFNTVRARPAREGLGTVRARLAWGGLGTVRASLGGSQFYKRNPFQRNFRKAENFAQKSVCGGEFYKWNLFKRNLWKPQNYAQKLRTEDPILLYTKFKKYISL